MLILRFFAIISPSRWLLLVTLFYDAIAAMPDTLSYAMLMAIARYYADAADDAAASILIDAICRHARYDAATRCRFLHAAFSSFAAIILPYADDAPLRHR